MQMNEACDRELDNMDDDQLTKSRRTLADNQRWMNEHPAHIFHKGDLPVGGQSTSTELTELGMFDQQQ